MRVAIVSGSRGEPPMGLELAERRLLEAIRARASPGVEADVRVVGGRAAWTHARRIGAKWIPARPGTLPPRATGHADLVHLLGLDLPPPGSQPFVVMVHDLSSLHYDDEGQLPPWIDDIAERASFVFTPSRFTADEVMHHLGVSKERIRVIGGAPALNASNATPLTNEELAGLGVSPPFVLRYGGYTTRKNVPLLLEAWSRVELGTLVLAGPPQRARERVLAEAPSLDRVVVLDYVSETLLARLLRSASALVSTSSYEGFGLPLLEAMAAGAPVVAIATPFTRELCGDAGCFPEPDGKALARAITRIFEDAALARRLSDAGLARAEKHGWSPVAEGVVEAYSAAC